MNQQERPTTTLKTEGGLIRIREPYANSPNRTMNILFGIGDETFGVMLHPDEAREFAIEVKLIAEKIITEAK